MKLVRRETKKDPNTVSTPDLQDTAKFRHASWCGNLVLLQTPKCPDGVKTKKTVDMES